AGASGSIVMRETSFWLTVIYPLTDGSPRRSSSAHSSTVTTVRCPVMAFQHAVRTASMTIMVSTKTTAGLPKSVAPSRLERRLHAVVLKECGQIAQGQREQRGGALYREPSCVYRRSDTLHEPFAERPNGTLGVS